MKQIKAVLLTFVGLVLLVAFLASLKVAQFKAMAQGNQGAAVETVTAVEVRKEQWEPTLNAIGSLAAFQGVTVTTESSGIISKICFEAGTSVKAGDLLVTLDTSVLEAQLQASEARAELAKLNAERARELFARNTTPKAELDSSEAQFKQAVAEVASIKAQISQKQVRAPFAGRLGIRQINVGQYLDRGNAIVSLQSLDPIYVNFTMPQQQLAKLVPGMTVRIAVDALPGQTFEGKLTAVNADVDSVTRNVRAQATFVNTDERLRPGMFVNVSVVLPQQDAVEVIPITSVLYAPYGDSVFVIEEKMVEGSKQLVLRQQFVRLGKTRGDFVTILSGLKPGEKIVSTGVFKLRNGMSVSIDNTFAPQTSENPKPTNS